MKSTHSFVRSSIHTLKTISVVYPWDGAIFHLVQLLIVPKMNRSCKHGAHHKALTYDVEVRQTMKLPISTKQTIRFIIVPAGVLETAVELNGSLKYRTGDRFQFILFMLCSSVYKVNMILTLLQNVFMAYSNLTSAGTV